METPSGISIRPGRLARLKEVGVTEFWLQDWLASDLTRLGLGPLSLVRQEQAQAGGGSLDILAEASGTYYSIEVQLGEVDSSHSFRVFDYWARNKRRYPNEAHVAVLVAESASGRFRDALEELAELVPLLVVEMRAWAGASEVVLVPELVVANESIDVGETLLGVSSGEVGTEDGWKERASAEAWAFYCEFLEWAKEELGDVRPDFSPKSYIGVRVGRRVWAPLWLKMDGASTWLPDPDHSRGEESVAFSYFQERLAEEGLVLNWQTTYNAGANPMSIRLRRGDLRNEAVQELLRASFEALKPGARRWSKSSAQVNAIVHPLQDDQRDPMA
ncbi:hypothetical protein G6010_00535 [Dietzia sp. SLG510A3-3B2-2]|nr:hypothetical protein [Dietzia sp. SLG510A3-40A3]MBB1008115.1 hypothetical protein [Dietzia sp. SLG510A3-3B2-2]